MNEYHRKYEKILTTDDIVFSTNYDRDPLADILQHDSRYNRLALLQLNVNIWTK